jgi:hypothetical protein
MRSYDRHWIAGWKAGVQRLVELTLNLLALARLFLLSITHVHFSTGSCPLRR